MFSLWGREAPASVGSVTPQQVADAVLRAVEGEIFEDVCGKYASAKKDCRHQSHCGISPVWQKLGRMIEGYFDGITLAQLLEEGSGCGKAVEFLAMSKGENDGHNP